MLYFSPKQIEPCENDAFEFEGSLPHLWLNFGVWGAALLFSEHPMIMFSLPEEDGWRTLYVLEKIDYQEAVGSMKPSPEYERYFSDDASYRPITDFNPPERNNDDMKCTDIMRVLMERAKKEYFSEDVIAARHKIPGATCVQIEWSTKNCDTMPSVFPLERLENLTETDSAGNEVLACPKVHEYLMNYRLKQYEAILGIITEGNGMFAKSLRKMARKMPVDDDDEEAQPVQEEPPSKQVEATPDERADNTKSYGHWSFSTKKTANMLKEDGRCFPGKVKAEYKVDVARHNSYRSNGVKDVMQEYAAVIKANMIFARDSGYRPTVEEFKEALDIAMTRRKHREAITVWGNFKRSNDYAYCIGGFRNEVLGENQKAPMTLELYLKIKRIKPCEEKKTRKD